MIQILSIRFCQESWVPFSSRSAVIKSNLQVWETRAHFPPKRRILHFTLQEGFLKYRRLKIAPVLSNFLLHKTHLQEHFPSQLTATKSELNFWVEVWTGFEP